MGTRSDLAPRGFCICVTVETRRSVNRQDYLSTCLTKLTGKRATAMTSESVKVIVRCRPMNDREEKLNCQIVVDMDTTIAQVQLKKPQSDNAPPKCFSFDGVYYMLDTTQQIYEDICFPLVEGVLEGYNGTVFAYGQTGCGKSFTMMGVKDPTTNRGIIPRVFEHIFDSVAVSDKMKYLIRSSYLEIYNEEVRDLLGKDAKKKLELHEHPEKGVYVKGLSQHKVHNVHDLEKVMELGSKNRSVGATLMNVDSSRSHSIFTIDLEMIDAEGEKGGLRAGRLNLVDLAGSERQSKTGSTGERLKEATKINLSLSALGNVISALVDGKSKHIPYRDSKLTRLLQSSLGGNTKTLMVACVSPADNNYDETLSTLRYANRAKNIKNKPRINEDPKDALLREYKEEIERLKKMLLGNVEAPAALNGIEKLPAQQQAHPFPSSDQLMSLEDEKEAIRQEYEAKLATLQAQFNKEQSDKAKLQEEFLKLQQARDEQLAQAQERFEIGVSEQVSQGGGEGGRVIAPTSDGLVTTESVQSVGFGLPSAKGSGNDEVILKEHEKAMQRLEELQREMIGGEKAGDVSLMDHLQGKRQWAENRLLSLRQANDLLDDDGIVERIFNSLTEEVKVKTQLLERTQSKLHSALEDNKDLAAEFEMDRQDYLDTIRKQQMTIKLQEQLLETIVPCLRRDCNYYNLDKVKAECVWDKEQSYWILPRLTVSKSVLSPVTSGSSLPERSASNSKMPKQNSSGDMQMRDARATTYDPPSDDRYLAHLQKSEESDYFKPRRVLELLSHKKETPHEHTGWESGPPLPQSTATAASVHGVDTLVIGDVHYSRRPGKLQSLPSNPLLPQNIATLPESNILDKVERKISNRKRYSLEPLSDKPGKP